MKLQPQPTATVLVVDDEALIRWSVGERLRGDGVRVFEAATLRAARRVLSEHDVDLVVLDIRLPDGSGEDLLAEIIAARPGRPVVMISAHGDDLTEAAVVERGALCLVHKPFDVDALAAAVEAALTVTRAVSGT